MTLESHVKGASERAGSGINSDVEGFLPYISNHLVYIELVYRCKL